MNAKGETTVPSTCKEIRGDQLRPDMMGLSLAKGGVFE